MCLFWKARQARLGIDDFGNPLPDAPPNSHFQHHVNYDSTSPQDATYVSRLVAAGAEVASPVEQEQVVAAVQDAVESTPLLPSSSRDGRSGDKKGGMFWSIFRP